MIYFDNRTEDRECEKYFKCVETVVTETLRNQGADEDTEVSVSFVDEGEIRRLNRQYRGKDSVTDVLSFPLIEPDEFLTKNKLEELGALGDIVICFLRAKEQAERYGHGIERETAFLTVHSMLHLFGYDHEHGYDIELNPYGNNEAGTEKRNGIADGVKGEKEMFLLQEKILNCAGFGMGKNQEHNRG